MHLRWREGFRARWRVAWNGWKRLAERIAAVQTFLVLLIIFVAVLGPTALAMKVLRKDPMGRPTEAGSFWSLRERTREGMKECVRQF